MSTIIVTEESNDGETGTRQGQYMKVGQRHECDPSRSAAQSLHFLQNLRRCLLIVHYVIEQSVAYAPGNITSKIQR
jgi:hypothetical protein